MVKVLFSLSFVTCNTNLTRHSICGTHCSGQTSGKKPKTHLVPVVVVRLVVGLHVCSRDSSRVVCSLPLGVGTLRPEG